MNIFDVEKATQKAKSDLRAVDSQVAAMANLIVGRLRHVKGYIATDALVALKKELRDFNSVTRCWKD